MYRPRTFARGMARRRANLNAKRGELARYPALSAVLYEPSLVIERQLEFGSVIAGIEQSRVFRMYTARGDPIGELAELGSQRFGSGIAGFLLRQITRRNRPFGIEFLEHTGLDGEVETSLELKRPLKLINSHVKASMANKILAESRQDWHLWRRRYNLYTASDSQQEMNQFGAIDAPFLSLSFPITDENGALIGNIDRRWTGFGRELFTDTGCYTLDFMNLKLEQRMAMLAATISIDFDYFSRIRRVNDEIVV